MSSIRDLIAFWIFGLANNYAYVIMLSAAEDIIAKQDDKPSNATDGCLEKIDGRYCDRMSTGNVLLANILPTLFVKLTFPFFMQRIPFGLRHFFVCYCQVVSFLTVAFSWNVNLALIGVVFASIGSGLGEICYLALSAHYSTKTVSLWSSGTGGAGIVGALAYAGLRDPSLANLDPQTAILSMLFVPCIFAITYWFVLTPSPSVHRMELLKPETWIVPKTVPPPEISKAEMKEEKESSNSRTQKVGDSSGSSFSSSAPNTEKQRKASLPSFKEKFLLILPLLHYLIPLSIVYFAEYLINQGLVQLIIFDCGSGFKLDKRSQYHWYQVMYQVGVFISRSSVNLIELSPFALYMLPILQSLNVIFFFFESIYLFVPHIAFVFALILFEGIFGGAAYVNTFNRIHKEARPESKEYILSIASLGDSMGIAAAGFAALPLHNFICEQPMSA